MSDLPRNFTTQPLDIPILGSDDTVYDAPGTDWDGTPLRAEMSNGAQADGFSPATRIYPEYINFLVGVVGEAVASVMDAPALTWCPVHRSLDVDYDPSFSGGGNALFALCKVPADPASSMGGELIAITNSDGMWTSHDGFQWEQREALGFSGPPAPEGMVAGVQGGESRIVVFARESGSNLFRYTNDFGESFAAAGDATAVAAGALRMGFFNGYFFLFAEAQIFYTDGTEIVTPGTWAGGDTTGDGWSANEPTMFAASPTEALIGIDGAPYVMRTADGVTWAPANSGLSQGLTAIVWSASHKLWFARDAVGQLWSAAEGVATWALVAEVPSCDGVAIGLIHGLACLGRTLVAAAGFDLYATRDLERWARIPVAPGQPFAVNLFWEYLFNFNGRLQAWKEDDGGHLESTASGVIAPELARLMSGGW